LAKQTLQSFNPCMILEFSATPPETANVLIDVPGMDLLAEQMIKLDLHVVSKSSKDWRDTLGAGKERLDSLAQSATKYRARGGAYIRPICLIQVERTGADQRMSGVIHADDAKEHLIKRLGVDPAQIAIKTSEKDELPTVDDENGLMSEGSPIRFIITKQALQEGWDCPFAYVLVVLTNPASRTGMTQLLGRILRQPYARKTLVKELDESYVYCFWKAKDLMDTIRDGFKREGMGDLQGHVNTSSGTNAPDEKIAALRPEFKKAVSRPILPVFVNRQNQPVRYESDILRRLDWDKVDISDLEKLPLNILDTQDTEITATLDANPAEAVKKRALEKATSSDSQEVSPALLAQQWLDAVPNPWRAFELATRVLVSLTKAYGPVAVQRNIVSIGAAGRRHLEAQVEALAESAFKAMLKKGELRFVLIGKEFSAGGSVFPKTISYPSGGKRLRDENDEEVQRSLFDYVPEDEFNGTEQEVALFLEKQERMFFWYRNRSKKDYGIQGWRRHRLYPDFIFTTLDKPQDKDFDRIYVMETKGAHLMGNEKTQYLQAVLNLCTEQAKPTSRTELGLKLQGKITQYEVLPEKEWETRLAELMDGDA
jgi:type III restriction enzyme